MIKTIISVDDTDDISKKTSTGKVAEMMANEVKSLGGVINLGITRHQLLLHKDIAYTSHNSAMCFSANIPKEKVEQVWDKLCEILKGEMAETSDPGMCLCRFDLVLNIHKLISFGKRAQKVVLQKEEAFLLAGETGVRLEEFGGAGLGVIGALAGVGLRLSGNDGTFRGKGKTNLVPRLITVRECKKELKVSQVMTTTGKYLSDENVVALGRHVKLLYFGYQKIAFAKEQEDGTLKICEKPDLLTSAFKQFDSNVNCKNFILDNDTEECYNDEKSCYNCLFRRCTPNGILCVNV